MRLIEWTKDSDGSRLVYFSCFIYFRYYCESGIYMSAISSLVLDIFNSEPIPKHAPILKLTVSAILKSQFLYTSFRMPKISEITQL